MGRDDWLYPYKSNGRVGFQMHPERKVGQPEIDAGASCFGQHGDRDGRHVTTGVLTMTKFLHDFMTEESGAAAAEYALILAIVGAGIAAAAYGLGTAISGSMTATATKVTNCSANGNGAGC